MPVMRLLRRIIFFFIVYVSSSCSKSPVELLIGTYTEGSSEGIYLCYFDQSRGSILSGPVCVAALPDPSYLAVNRDGSRVYAVSERPDSTAALVAYAFSKAQGAPAPSEAPLAASSGSAGASSASSCSEASVALPCQEASVAGSCSAPCGNHAASSGSEGDSSVVASMASEPASQVSAASYGSRLGNLRLLSYVPTIGASPCYVDIYGRLAVTANYSGGSISVFRLGEDGSIKDPLPHQLIKGGVGGPDSLRQARPHVHCTVFSPDGRFLLASDFSSDKLLCFSVSDSGLVFTSSVRLERDTGPRHIVFHNDPSIVYVIGELSGKVTSLHFSEGSLKTLRTFVCDDLSARGSADIRISPDGRFLYASNRLKNDGIAVFRIEENGFLSKVDYINTGIHPRNIVISPNGKYLLASCRDSGAVQIFRRSKRTGRLFYTGKSIGIDRPVCAVFVE